MKVKRKTHSAKFKAKIALEAYKGDKTAVELISMCQISFGQISAWNKHLTDGVTQLFESGQHLGLPITHKSYTKRKPIFKCLFLLKPRLNIFILQLYNQLIIIVLLLVGNRQT